MCGIIGSMAEGGFGVKEAVGLAKHVLTEKKLRQALITNPIKSAIDEKRFELSMKGNAHLVVESIRDVGWENFDNLPKDLRPVIASTHFTDTDVQGTAGEFAARVKHVGVASFATNQRDPLLGRLIRIAGSRHFYDVDNKKVGGRDKPSFNSDNILAMWDAVKKGMTMVVASHNPAFEKRVLPANSGMAVVLLAQLTDRVVVPTAFHINAPMDQRMGMSDQIGETAMRFVKGKKPKATLSIGEAIFLEPIPQEDVLLALRVLSARDRRRLSPEEKSESLDALRRIKGPLRAQSEMILLAQAALLPPESRGIWNERLAQAPVAKT